MSKVFVITGPSGVGKGTLIRLTAPAATVFIANPDVADVQVKSPSLIYITAKSPGETVIYAVDASDRIARRMLRIAAVVMTFLLRWDDAVIVGMAPLR